MGDGFEGLRQGHTTHGCAIIEQRGEVEPNPLWHRVLSFVMVGREFYSISPLLRNACVSDNPYFEASAQPANLGPVGVSPMLTRRMTIELAILLQATDEIPAIVPNALEERFRRVPCI